MGDAAALERRYRRNAALCGLALLLAVALATSLGAFHWLDLLTYDLQVQLRGASTASGRVVLVYMDEASAGELGRAQGYWSRRQLAAALQQLNAAGAEIIGLDLLLTRPAQQPEDDVELATAMEQAGNVVVARVAAVPGVGSLEAIAPFSDAMLGDGFIDLPLDRDGSLRRIRFLAAEPLADGSLSLTPAFALELTRTYLNLAYQFDFSPTDHFLLGADDQQRLRLPYPELWIHFLGGEASFPRLSYADVVNGRFDPQQVAGRIVLIGSRLASDKDLFSTPFTRYRSQRQPFERLFARVVADVQEQRETGLACHAQAIETLLAGRFLQPAGPAARLALLLLCGLAGQLLFYRRSLPLPAAPLLALLLILFAGGSQGAFLAGYWLPLPAALLLLVGQFVAGHLLQKNHEKQRSQWITQVFGRYVSTSIVERLLRGELTADLRGQRAELTIFFADLRDFTRLAEELDARQTAELLNRYFSCMLPELLRQQGTLDKLIGDAILAFFGAPLPSPQHPAQAARAALALLQRLETLRQEPLAGADRLDLAIGINSGEVTIGNLGCDSFMDYTVIGDTVNLASRLEGLNRVYGTRILLSGATAARLPDHEFCLRLLDRVTVKGKQHPIDLYELVGEERSISPAQRQMLQHFASGGTAWRQRDWARARAEFEQALALAPLDGPSRLYLQRVAECEQRPPAADWDGLSHFQHK